jgi:dTDP-glucose pyrophosphorylase/CBS domain-containing protein
LEHDYLMTFLAIDRLRGLAGAARAGRAAKEWRATLVRDDATIREAIRAIDESALQIALIVDTEQRLVGTVTDGDVRRGLLRGTALDAPVADIMNRDPIACPVALGRDAALTVMRGSDVKQVPLIDDSGRVVGLELIGDVIKRVERKNWVVLMAGGLGQRLRPLTEDCPKPMLPVGGTPILEIILKNFVRQGFDRFFLAVNYKAEMVRRHFGDGSRWGVTIDYLEERDKLGTAGALGLLPERPREPLLIMNGDLLTAINFGSMLEFHAEQQAMATMAVREHTVEVPFGVIDLADDYLAGLTEKPRYSWFINAGVYIVEPSVLDLVEPGLALDMPALFERVLKRNEKIAAFPVREYWRDIGRLEDLERAGVDYPGAFDP